LYGVPHREIFFICWIALYRSNCVSGKEHEYAATPKGRFKKPEARGNRNCAKLWRPRAIRLDPAPHPGKNQVDA
jgi:hypothetical protein